MLNQQLLQQQARYTKRDEKAQHYQKEYEKFRKSPLYKAYVSKYGLAASMMFDLGLRDPNMRGSILSGVGKATGKTGLPEMATEALSTPGMLPMAVGGTYLGMRGISTTARNMRMAQEKQYSKELGGIGKASRGFDNLMRLNRLAYTLPMGASLMMGKQWGGPSLWKALGAAGVGTGTAMAGTIGLGMGLAILKSMKMAKVTPSKKPASKFTEHSIADRYASQIGRAFQQKDPQAIQIGLMNVGIGLLQSIEKHISATPVIAQMLDYQREAKDKLIPDSEKEYDKYKRPGKKKIGDKIFDNIEYGLSSALTKFDPISQLINFIATGKLPHTVIKELKAAYDQDPITQKERDIAAHYGLGTAEARILGADAGRILARAKTYEGKMLSLTSGMLDTNILMARAMVTMTRAQGITDLAYTKVDPSKTTLGQILKKIGMFPLTIGEAITKLPVFNAVFNALKFISFDIPKFIGSGLTKISEFGEWYSKLGRQKKDWKTGGIYSLIEDETKFEKELGIHKTDQEKAYSFMGRGLPVVMSRIEDIAHKQLFIQKAMLQVLEDAYGVKIDDSELAKSRAVVWDPVTNRFSTLEEIKDFKDKLKLEYVKDKLGGSGIFSRLMGKDPEKEKELRAFKRLQKQGIDRSSVFEENYNIPDIYSYRKEHNILKEKGGMSHLFGGMLTAGGIITAATAPILLPLVGLAAMAGGEGAFAHGVSAGKKDYKWLQDNVFNVIGKSSAESLSKMEGYEDSFSLSTSKPPLLVEQTDRVVDELIQINTILNQWNESKPYGISGGLPIMGPAQAAFDAEANMKNIIVYDDNESIAQVVGYDMGSLDNQKTEIQRLQLIKNKKEKNSENQSPVISDQPSVKEQHEKMKKEGKEEKRDEEQEKQTGFLENIQNTMGTLVKYSKDQAKNLKGKGEGWWKKLGLGGALMGTVLMAIFSKSARLPMALGAIAGLSVGGIPGAIIGGFLGGAAGIIFDKLMPEGFNLSERAWNFLSDKVGDLIANYPGIATMGTALVGAKIGAMLGGWNPLTRITMALLGGVIGGGIGMLLPMFSDKMSPDDKKEFYHKMGKMFANNSAITTLAGVGIGATIGLGFGGLPGALLGAIFGGTLGVLAPDILSALGDSVTEDGKFDFWKFVKLFSQKATKTYVNTADIIGKTIVPLPDDYEGPLYKLWKFLGKPGKKEEETPGYATGGKVIPLNGQDYSFNVGEQGAEQVTIKDGVISIKPNPSANESQTIMPSSNTHKKMSKQVVQSPPLTGLVNRELSKLNTYDNKLIAPSAVEGFKEGARYGTMEALYGATYGAIIGNVIGQDLQPHKVQKIQKQISSQKSEEKKELQVDKIKEDLKKYNVLSESEWMLYNFDIASGPYNPDDYQIYLMKHGIFKDKDGRIKKLPTNLEKRRQKQGDPWKGYDYKQTDSTISDDTDDLLTNPLKLLGHFFKKIDEKNKPKKYSAELHAFYRNPKQRIPLKKLFEHLQTGGLTDNRVYWVYDEKLGLTNIPVAVECVPLVEKRSNDIKNMKKAAFDLLHYMVQAKTGINVSPETIHPVQYYEIITPNGFRIICCWNVMLGDVREKGSKYRSTLDQDADASAVIQSYNRTETERLHSSNPAIQIQQDSLPVTGSPDMEDNSYISNQSSFPLRTETERLHSNQKTNPTIRNVEQLSETTGTGLTQDSVGIVSPVDSNYITSPFGPRPNNKGMSDPHGGLDLRAKLGEPIYAAMSGTVVRTGGQFGEVVLSHGNGLHTRYLHLSGFNVEKGQQVQAGEVIGYSGGTGPKGASHYTPHLHYEVLKDGMKVDPEQFLKTAGINLTGGKSETEAGGLFDSVSNAVSGITGSLTGSGGIGGLLNQSISGITGPLQDMPLIGQAESMLRGGISNFVDAKIGGLTNQAMGLIDMGTGIFTNPEQLLKTSISGLTGPLSDIGSPKELLNKTIGELLATTDNPEKLLGSSISQILGQVGETTKSIDSLPWLDNVDSKAQDTATGFMDSIFGGSSSGGILDKGLGGLFGGSSSGGLGGILDKGLGGLFGGSSSSGLGGILDKELGGLFGGSSSNDILDKVDNVFSTIMSPMNSGSFGSSSGLGGILDKGLGGLFGGSSSGNILDDITSSTFDVFNNTLNDMMGDFNLNSIADKAQNVLSTTMSPMNSESPQELSQDMMSVLQSNQLSEPPSTPMKSGETPLMPEGAIELQSTIENVLMGQIDNLFGLSRHQLRQQVIDYAYGRMIYSSRSIA